MKNAPIRLPMWSRRLSFRLERRISPRSCHQRRPVAPRDAPANRTMAMGLMTAVIGRTRRSRSPPLPLGLALLQEGGDPLSRVLGAEQAHKLALLDLGRFVDGETGPLEQRPFGSGQGER